MAFVTKTWKDRLVEYAGRRKLKNVATGEEILMDVSRSEGTVNQVGDAFNATNMNNLEQRIKTEFDNVNSSLGGLSFAQDANGKWGYKVGADAVIPFKKGIVSFKMYQGYYTGSSVKHFGIDVTDFDKITYTSSTGFAFVILNSSGNQIGSYYATSTPSYIDITSWSGTYYFGPGDINGLATVKNGICIVELE
jgi:hypothetical protein